MAGARVTHAFMIGGLAAAGKTTFGLEVSAQTGLAIFDKDTQTEALVDALLTAKGSRANDRSSRTYIDEVRPVEYISFLAPVIQNVRLGNSVIAVAPFIGHFRDPRCCDEFQEDLNRNARYPVKLHRVWLHTEVEVRHQRMTARASERDVAKLANWTEQAQADASIRPNGEHILVDCSEEGRTSALVERLLSDQRIRSSARFLL